MRIKNYPKLEKADKSDVIIVDGDKGTRSMNLQTAFAEMSDTYTQTSHTHYSRGKYLGDQVTPEQMANVRNGSFDDLWVGDFWLINGFKWIIVDIDYWSDLGTTDDNATNKHHLMIMPEEPLDILPWHSVKDTTTAYPNSHLYKQGMTKARSIVSNAFGDYVSNVIVYTPVHYESANKINMDFVSLDLLLPTELMYYGTRIFTPAEATMEYQQIAYFRHNRRAQYSYSPKYSFWLRDTTGGTNVACITPQGNALLREKTGTAAIRPLFALA